MPLPLPSLDTLAFDELVNDALAELPAHAPAWTDYNAHDPGITLIELFAWLTEAGSYRLSRTSASAVRAFLRLVDAEPRAAQAATTMLVFSPNDLRALDVPQGTRVTSDDGGVEFQTAAALHVSPARLTVIASGTPAAFDELAIQGESQLLPFGAEPRVDDALYLGFDAPLAEEGAEITLAVFTGRDAEDAHTRERLEAEVRDSRAQWHPGCKGTPPESSESWNIHYGVRTTWEFHASDGWHPLADVVDETRAFTLSGIVRFKAPRPAAHVAGGLAAGAATTRFIRCRLAHGAYDCPPRVARLAINAVTARHSVDAASQSFESDGRANQTLSLEAEPVVPHSTRVTVTRVGGAPESWTEARSFDGVGPHARTYALDAGTATIRFGDGRHGRVPPADAALVVHYATGGGPAGNVRTLSRVRAANLDVAIEQPFAAHGGVAAETLNEAKARAVRQLAAVSRAATLEDFVSLASATPGVPVARAHAIADYHPRLGCMRVEGCITVVVLPPCPERRPEPSAALCAAVKRFLDRRRVLTTELHVVGPCYTAIAISARLHAAADADRRDIVRRAREALHDFFHPLRGGADGKGYPIGRAVYRSEVLALLNDVPGVTHVADLSWRVGERGPSICASAEICRHGLLVSGSHEITVDSGSACRD